ncbi:MAG: hypothetical protein ACRDSH_04415 [Pseudonocardiaceae bacterium]
MIGAQAGGRLRDAVNEVIMPDERTELEIRDMTGAYALEYGGGR